VITRVGLGMVKRKSLPESSSQLPFIELFLLDKVKVNFHNKALKIILTS
jgi:hypothetical protein